MRAIFGSYLWVKVSIKSRPYVRTTVILFGNEGLQAFDGFGCGYAAASVVEVD